MSDDWLARFHADERRRIAAELKEAGNAGIWRELLAPWPERCVARVDDDGHVLEYSCSHRTGHAIVANVWGSSGLPSPLRQQGSITLDFTFLRRPNTDDSLEWSHFVDPKPNDTFRHSRVTAKVNADGSGVTIVDPQAYYLAEILCGFYKTVTVSANGCGHTFWLAAARDAIKSAGWVGDPGYFPDGVRADRWKTFSHADLFEVDMPEITGRYWHLDHQRDHAAYSAGVEVHDTWSNADWQQHFREVMNYSLLLTDSQLSCNEIPGVGDYACQREERGKRGADDRLIAYRYIKTGSHLITLSAHLFRVDAGMIANKDRFMNSLRIL